MLTYARSLGELRFGELMAVYADSNREAAGDWPDLPPMFALQMAEEDFYQYLRDVFFPVEGAVQAIWTVEGKYVSTLRLEPYRDGMLLAGLETLPGQRKKGYAAALIRQVQQDLKAQGVCSLYSHVHKGNAASRRTHESCGFSEISDHAVYINGNVDYRCSTLLCRIDLL